MLYYLHLLTEIFSPFRIFRYITFRALCGAATAFLLSIVLGPWLIRQLRKLKVGQQERKEEAPPLYVLHARKEGTPTMGGVLIIASVVISSLLWAVPLNPFVLLTLATMCWMGLIGFCDDRAKLLRKNTRGLSARHKLILQTAWAAVAVGVLLAVPDMRRHARELMVPFLKEPLVADMGIALTFLFVAVVLVGAANAVNLTDGLDGLAIGCSTSAAIAYLIMAYAAGNVIFAEYLRVPHVAGSGELAVCCGCLLGAGLGFLWYNCHPAHVFMGDTGSLALGGAIAMVAILIKQELVLVIVGGVFVIEALSVIVQVISFRARGKRVFAMAPLHHHFEIKGWSETQVTIRFWILSIIFALLGVATLKIR
jgi:phospho-N-acetylmuramoyl-pentapeptide-transferase